MVVECGNIIVGFMVYELHKRRIHLLNLAVGLRYVRLGIGRLMVRTLIRKLSDQGRSQITTEVRESNLSAQLFLRDMGFRAESVLVQFYPDRDEDAYLMVYDIDLSP